MCSNEYSCVYSLKEHITAIHQNVPFLCEICSKSFRSRRMLNLHRSRIHGDNGKFTCGYCNKKMSCLKSVPRSHQQAYICINCLKSFYCKSSLQRHAISCQGENERVKCAECDKVFKSSNTLNDHVKGKHEPKDKTCKCGKAFAWHTSHSRHMTTCKVGK